MEQKYLAFTLGPVYQTMLKAKKTRELWGSSFLFSLLMRELLTELNSSNTFTILLPNFSTALSKEKIHGAGIWPDRCIVKIEDNESIDINKIIDKVLLKMGTVLVVPAVKLKPLLQIYALKAKWTKEELEDPGINPNSVAIHRINHLLDNLELRTIYQLKEKQTLSFYIEDNIHSLYKEGFDQQQNVFIDLGAYGVRLPSLPEIAAREFRETEKKNYEDHFEKPISAQVIEYRKQQQNNNRDFGDSEKENERMFLDLPASLKEKLKLRHKYIAIVKADGDNLGKIIDKLGQVEQPESEQAEQPLEEITAFSEKLMRFSKEAVKDIVDYGALPVYAGGDDLLFIAPVMSGKESCPDVFSLCDQLDQSFQNVFDNVGPTLSFGVSITYYKFPLGEALGVADQLLKKAKSFGIYEQDKKTAIHEKHALSFQVQKHSGQQFGAVLQLGSDNFENFLGMMQPIKSLEMAFLSSIMYKLESLPTLLADAADRNMLENFRKHQFNEGGHQDNAYLDKVMAFLANVFKEYGQFLPDSLEQKLEGEYELANRNIRPINYHKTNIVFAALRIKQFLIQPDHD